ncbi:MAG: hypothetical protein FWD86_03115, partial [Firmicutes bacterium]|nr:hypothetical protein [Bacillota bacterium]
MLISANFFTRAIARIVEGAGDPMWWTSQAFALVAFVCFIWGWQIKNKIRMMFLVGIASAALAVSASLVENWSLGALFGLAAVRNFVFCTLDWYDSVTKRVTGKGNGCAEWTKTQNPKVLNMFKTKQPLPSWLRYMFAGFFAVATVTITTLFLTVPALLEKVPFFAEANTYIMVGREKVWQTHIVPIEGAILEIGICLTLLGLILGNILSGTKLMRSSFVAN